LGVAQHGDFLNAEGAMDMKTPAKKRIEQRAYELYLERGGPHGKDLQDWLNAEGELTFEQFLSEIDEGDEPIAY
jgi:hypothetical protein